MVYYAFLRGFLFAAAEEFPFPQFFFLPFTPPAAPVELAIRCPPLMIFGSP